MIVIFLNKVNEIIFLAFFSFNSNPHKCASQTQSFVTLINISVILRLNFRFFDKISPNQYLMTNFTLTISDIQCFIDILVKYLNFLNHAHATVRVHESERERERKRERERAHVTHHYSMVGILTRVISRACRTFACHHV